MTQYIDGDKRAMKKFVYASTVNKALEKDRKISFYSMLPHSGGWLIDYEPRDW